MAEEFGEPIAAADGGNKRMWIIIAVVVVVLCCCCVAAGLGGWYLWENGDEIFGLANHLSQTLAFA